MDSGQRVVYIFFFPGETLVDFVVVEEESGEITKASRGVGIRARCALYANLNI